MSPVATNSQKYPQTVIMPKCFAENSIWVWFESICQDIKGASRNGFSYGDMLARLRTASHRGHPGTGPWCPASGCSFSVREHMGKLVPRVDSELGECFVEVVLDRLRADKQLARDFLIRTASARQKHDLLLLFSQRAGRINRALTCGLPCSQNLAACALSKDVRAHCRKHIIRCSELFARFEPASRSWSPTYCLLSADRCWAGPANRRRRGHATQRAARRHPRQAP
jgi:hypothetical protein